MNREQIKQAAEDYAYKNWGGGGFEVASSDSFAAGADWRINSVWHKPTPYGEEVQRNVDVIAHFKSDFYFFGRFMAVGFFHEHLGFKSTSGIEYAMSDILEYAYLADLIPERKEDAK